MSDERPLIAVTVKLIKQEPYLSAHGGMAQSAIIVGRSKSRDSSFEFQTGLLDSEPLRRCGLLQQHGFTAVEAPEDWQYGYHNKPGGWQHAVIMLAMDRVAAIYENKERGSTVAYNEELAKEVLEALNKTYPNPVQTVALKHALGTEPSDAELLTVLHALYLDKLIEGKPLQGSTNASGSLVAMANIQISSLGRKQVQGQAAPAVAASAVVHGDQYFNFGQAGAIGSNAVGSINYQPQWIAIQNQVNLPALAIELEELKSQLLQTASSSADFAQVALVAQAKEQAEAKDGSKVLETLSKTGSALLAVAKEIGTDVAAKVITIALGIES